MSDNLNNPWEFRCHSTVYEFALQCAKLRDENPYDLSSLACDLSVLEYICTYLTTELWDRGFSQTEIRKAFEIAGGEALTHYGAGEDRRDDKLRR